MRDKFRFLFVNQEPDTYACANSTLFSLGRTVNCPQPGLSFEMFQIYTSALDVEPVISWISNSFEDVGGYDEDDVGNGTWTGAFARILNGSIDTLAMTMSQTEIRDQYFDFSYPFYQADLVYMVRSNEISWIVTAFDALLSFNPQVWLLYLIAIAILTVCLLAASFTHSNTDSASLESNINYNYLLWGYFRYLLDKSEGDMRQRSISGNIALIFSGIAAIIMLSLYESSLLAELLMRKETLPFRTQEELAALIKTKQYKLLFDNPFHWYIEELQSNSNSSHYVLMRDALKKNPYVIADNSTYGLNLLRQGGYIFPTGTDSSRLYRASEYCEIDFITVSGTPQKYAQYVFRKNSTLHKRFNAAVISVERLTNRAWQIYYGSVAAEKRAQMCKTPPNVLSPLSLKTLIGLFALLLAGATISIIIFLTEIVLKCYKKVTECRD